MAGTSPAPGSGRRSFRQITRLNDPTGDAGLEAPKYADAAHVTVEDGTDDVRVTVEMAGVLPSRLVEGEVMGVGLDLYRPDSEPGGESDYQLFADGGVDGWIAYLQTPDGFIPYPGSFAVGDRRLVFTIPWEAIGRPESGSLSLFVDWSKRATPLNQAGEDFAPDTGTVDFKRA